MRRNGAGKEKQMRIGEVCLCTGDVIRLANFYRLLLGIEGSNDDPVHQTLLADETMLTVYNDGTEKNNCNQNICLAFTVSDMDSAYAKVLDMGAEVIAPPAKRPWGAVNMSFYDPDRNVVYLRSFPADDAAQSQTTSAAKRKRNEKFPVG